ncbi:TPA: class I SAM-dependent methyltransferase, partial [Pseudomonas aeruginosa]|nr:class I SAM-dependent methyltransferase [Pseudomonas aeruginosa]
MQTKYTINSDAYWDSRFVEDWESLQGPAQSRFFARLAIENLPRWLIDQLQRQPLTLCDWGCAQGDGTDVWASYVDSDRITGIDFSSVAVDQALKRYPAIRFLNEDWLAAQPGEQSVFDVVFSSNTLEHFHKPHAVLKSLCSRATKALVLALPYRELDRHHEHFYTFLPDNIPTAINGGFKLVWSRVVDCRQISNTLWGGDQIVLVYANSDWTDALRLTLRDFGIEQSDFAAKIVSLNQAVTERDGQI